LSSVAVTPATGPELTLLEAIVRRLRACRATPDGVEPPAAILWTDPGRQWLPLVDAVKTRLPELLTLGDFDPDQRTGPALWLRCVVDGTVEIPEFPEGQVPIIYLPGIGRQHLRAGEDCARALQPLVELMYRGTLWLQKGGHEWTVTAFLTSSQGLGLDLARDQKTMDALPRALREVAETSLAQFRGRRLEAEDFDKLLTTDLFRDLLRWMSDPPAWRERIGPERWGAFRSQCGAQLDFDPEADGELVAGRRLGAGEGLWSDAWARFEEAPTMYPGVPEVLRRCKPTDLFLSRSRWPDENEAAEETVEAALREVADLPPGAAHERIIQLEAEHSERREWVWARMGLSPLAGVLQPLAELATHSNTTMGGETPDEIGRMYSDISWRADAAAWRSMSLAPSACEALIHDVVRCLMAGWLDDSARVFQRVVERDPLPVHSEAAVVEVSEGGCLLFADGLRYDLGQSLAERLEGRGCRVNVGHRWAALPTVTATAKPAVTPVAQTIFGTGLPDDFAPLFPVPGSDSEGRKAIASRIRTELEEQDYQVLQGGLGDWPTSDSARGWTEDGSIDSLGHKLGVGLARQIDSELNRLAERVVALLDGGWTSVRVVTDHGWLLLPGGLPKIDLPKHLTASRWARCATVAGASEVSVPTAPWHWNPEERFATPPGISAFNKSPDYSHGGLSIQECLIPDLLVDRTDGGTTRATIESVTWRGMRCTVQATVGDGNVQADLRLEGAGGPSVVPSAKALDEDGRVSLILADDSHEGADLTLVLIEEDGTVLAQRATRGGDTT